LSRSDATICRLIDWWCSGGTAQSAVVSGAVRCNARAAFCCAAQQALYVSPPVEGKVMTSGVKPTLGDMALSEMTGLTGHRDPQDPHGSTRVRLVVLPVVVAVGFLTWGLVSAPSDAESQPQPAASPVSPVPTASRFDPAVTPTDATLASPAEEVAPAETVPAAVAPVEAATPLDGLKISSQSWRRGGLGSNALVTLTLRNRNDYAVRDIEIACAFSRRDGSHLTDRSRTIHDTVNMKSRKTFARMHVGFININANKAKCALVAASRI
jgi:hypothetical protein